MESELMQDQNIRKAVEMGIDKEGFCSVIMQGRGVPAKAAFPSSFSYGNDAVKLFLMTRMERKNSLKNPAGQIQMVTDMWIRMEKN